MNLRLGLHFKATKTIRPKHNISIICIVFIAIYRLYLEYLLFHSLSTQPICSWSKLGPFNWEGRGCCFFCVCFLCLFVVFFFFEKRGGKSLSCNYNVSRNSSYLAHLLCWAESYKKSVSWLQLVQYEYKKEYLVSHHPSYAFKFQRQQRLHSSTNLKNMLRRLKGVSRLE